jgi:hypothetical protein
MKFRLTKNIDIDIKKMDKFNFIVKFFFIFIST